MRDRLIEELKHFVNYDLEEKTFKELLDIYNLIFNYEYASQQKEDCLPQSSFSWN